MKIRVLIDDAIELTTPTGDTYMLVWNRKLECVHVYLVTVGDQVADDDSIAVIPQFPNAFQMRPNRS